MKVGLSRFAAAALLVMAVTGGNGQERRRIIVGGEERRDKLVAHELEWWTEDPLRLDENDDMRFFQMADDGHAYTPRDYQVEQTVTPLGVVAGRRVIEVLETIYFEQRLVMLGVGSNDKPAQWKSLLVETAKKDKYVEVYRLQAGGGLYPTLGHAAVHGTGLNALLETYDPEIVRAGGCADGVWWFDSKGVHAVDFSPLVKAMHKVISKGGEVTVGCVAVRPEKNEARVLPRNADCESCEGVRGVKASYRIERGAAVPVKVRAESMGGE